MPFKSRKQEKWMWANKPKIAREWEDIYGTFKGVHPKKNHK